MILYSNKINNLFATQTETHSPFWHAILYICLLCCLSLILQLYVRVCRVAARIIPSYGDKLAFVGIQVQTQGGCSLFVWEGGGYVPYKTLNYKN